MHTYVGAIFESSTQNPVYYITTYVSFVFGEHVSMKMKAPMCLSTASQGC